MTPRKRKNRILVKGYMRPDGTSYYVAIPKPIRELLGLEGGEYFIMKADAKDGEIELKLVDLKEDTTAEEDSPDPTVRAEVVEKPSAKQEKPEQGTPDKDKDSPLSLGNARAPEG